MLLRIKQFVVWHTKILSSCLYLHQKHTHSHPLSFSHTQKTSSCQSLPLPQYSFFFLSLTHTHTQTLFLTVSSFLKILYLLSLYPTDTPTRLVFFYLWDKCITHNNNPQQLTPSNLTLLHIISFMEFFIQMCDDNHHHETTNANSTIFMGTEFSRTPKIV